MQQKQKAFHSNNSYDHFNIPDNINDFNSSSNQSYDSISKASSILKDDNEELSKSFNELQVNSNEDNQTNYVKEIVEQQQIKNMFNVDDEDEIYDDKNFHSEEQDELEIPDGKNLDYALIVINQKLCQICNSKRFQKDFNKWTSGNEHIDEFIQDVQLKARNRREMDLSKYWIIKNNNGKRIFDKLKDEDYENAKQLNIKSPLSENVKYGWHFIAPEVLRGKPYTKAADIYSFGIIMWEMNSGIPAFSNVPHDLNLTLNICQGPKQYEDLEVEYLKLMKRCWDPDPSKTTTAEELYENFDGWHDKLLIITNNVNSISIDERIPTIYNW
ncbi:kinase-like protein [Rhizophagus irregularis]|uniref:Kinase-like protein n=1 Tax=Rhizophagus irregularis TaxID=588596 RepID=A0A2I1HGV4_9GLOM|nr:kinase-like protein [Rhizophagus irregularis]